MQKKERKKKRIKKENSIVTIEARGDCDPRNLGKVIPKDSGASRITFIGVASKNTGPAHQKQ